jgi:hypothetical protein
MEGERDIPLRCRQAQAPPAVVGWRLALLGQPTGSCALPSSPPCAGRPADRATGCALVTDTGPSPPASIRSCTAPDSRTGLAVAAPVYSTGVCAVNVAAAGQVPLLRGMRHEPCLSRCLVLSLYLQAPPVFCAYKARVLYVVYVPFRPCSTGAAHAHCVYSPVHRSACRPPAARGVGAGCGGVAMLAAGTGTGQTPGRGGAATARDRERRGHSERAPVDFCRREEGRCWRSLDRQTGLWNPSLGVHLQLPATHGAPASAARRGG